MNWFSSLSALRLGDATDKAALVHRASGIYKGAPFCSVARIMSPATTVKWVV